MNEEKDEKQLSFKEFLVLLLLTIIGTPILYNIVFAPMGWWLN